MKVQLRKRKRGYLGCPPVCFSYSIKIIIYVYSVYVYSKYSWNWGLHGITFGLTSSSVLFLESAPWKQATPGLSSCLPLLPAHFPPYPTTQCGPLNAYALPFFAHSQPWSQSSLSAGSSVLGRTIIMVLTQGGEKTWYESWSLKVAFFQEFLYFHFFLKLHREKKNLDTKESTC